MATECQDTNFSLRGGEELNLAKVIKAIILCSPITYG